MFNQLKKLDIQARTAWIDLPMITPTARLHLRPATEDNPRYYSAMLRMSGDRKRNLARGGTVNMLQVLDELQQNRADDVELYPRHVIIGWEGIEDEDGSPVPFSEDHAAQLMQALPGWVVDQIRNFAASPMRFVAPDEPPLPDPAELSGN